MYIYKIVLASIKLICLKFKVKFLCILLSLEHASLSSVWSISLNDCHTIKIDSLAHLGPKHQIQAFPVSLVYHPEYPILFVLIPGVLPLGVGVVRLWFLGGAARVGSLVQAVHVGVG